MILVELGFKVPGILSWTKIAPSGFHINKSLAPLRMLLAIDPDVQDFQSNCPGNMK